MLESDDLELESADSSGVISSDVSSQSLASALKATHEIYIVHKKFLLCDVQVQNCMCKPCRCVILKSDILCLI